MDFFDERHEVLVYDREEYEAEAKDIVERISEKRKLADKIEAGEIKSKPLSTIGKDVKVTRDLLSEKLMLINQGEYWPLDAPRKHLRECVTHGQTDKPS